MELARHGAFTISRSLRPLAGGRTWSTLPACQQAYYCAAGTTTYSASSPIATRSPPPAS